MTTDTVIAADQSTTEYELTNNNGVTFTVKENGKVKNIRSDKSGNTITVESGGQVTSSGVAEYTNLGIAGGFNNNNINIAGTVEKAVYGGFANSTTELSGNRITITGEVKSDVGGAYTDGAATNNHVVVKNGGKVNASVFGGYACYESATENTVTISGGTIGESATDNVYGGYSENGAADNKNTVKITGGTINGQVYGGYGKTGANNNIVEISGGTMKSTVNGGYGDNADSTATGNTVTISKGEIRGDVNGGFANSATGNKVNISSGIVNSVVYGGQGDTVVSGNEVTITGGEFNSVYGGFGRSEGSTATGNTVTVSDGTVKQDVYGGWSDSGDATYNEVNISGGTVNSNIYGGMGASEASGNTVTISDKATLGKNISIYGGLSTNGAAKNNTVNISKENLKVAHICVGDGGGEIYGNKLVLNATGVEAMGEGGVIANTIELGNSVTFSTEKTILKGSEFYGGNALDISKATTLKEAASGTMTLLESAKEDNFKNLSLTYWDGNATLTEANPSVEVYRSANPSLVNSGVTIDYNTLHTVDINPADSFKTVTYNAKDNASKLTFGNVEWKDSGALLNHKTTLSNISFDGAAVDTSKIAFTNKDYLATNSKMTLVSDFGTKAGEISGTAFTVGKGTGEGNAYYENGDLRYVVTKGVVEPEPDPQPQNDNAINQGGDPVSGNVDGDVIGGEAKNNGVAEQNTKEVLPNSQVNGNVTAATSENGAATKNEAKSTDADISGSVTGAQSQSGAVAKNKATVTGGSVGGNVVATSTDSGVATGNLTTVNNVNIGGDVVGAQSNSGTVSNGNKAEVTGGSVGGSVYGGKSDSGEVSANSVQISGGTVQQNVYGGQTDGGKAVYSNQVAISDATVTGTVYGGYSDKGTAESNQVQISGEARLGDVYGGKSAMASNNNVINFSGGTAHNLIGGGCDTAAGNTVNMDGGTVENIYGAQTGTSATNNQIYLGGGTVNQNVYGGYSDSGTTSGNSVTLYGAANVSAANLYGGNLEATGNVLNIGRIVEDNKVAWTGGGQSVNNISNFETMNFVAVPWSKEKAAVTISNGTATDLSGTKVSASKVHFIDTTSLKNGDTMTLLDEQRVAADKRVQTGNITKESTYTAGSTLEGKGILSMDDSGNVIYEVIDKNANVHTHNTVMGAEATMTALSAGNDFIGSAVEGLANSNNAGSDGLATYAKMGGGSMNVDTGSHINTHTWNAILALGHKNEKKLSTTEYGAFFEYGTGNYSTFNGDERGDGSTRYTGGGILGKWQKNNGFYVEGSLRAGSIHDDANNVLRDANGNPYSYTTDATYWGAHIGVGREIKLNKTAVLDLYAKYFYNHRGSVSFDAGGHYDLGAVESSVLRVGTRYTVKQNDNIHYYGGLAVEHEFCGRASGFADGVAIRGADISGTSVRGEIGATFRPGEKSNVTLDLNLSGFAGKKQGLTGGLSAVFHI